MSGAGARKREGMQAGKEEEGGGGRGGGALGVSPRQAAEMIKKKTLSRQISSQGFGSNTLIAEHRARGEL